MTLKNKIRNILWNIGYDISRFNPEYNSKAFKKQIFVSHTIDTVLDIGANTGQFAQFIRNYFGNNFHILSFEPLKTTFELLKTYAKYDTEWDVYNYAIGDADIKQEINIAGNSLSSSFLNMLPSHLISAPSSNYIGTEIVQIKTIDSLFQDLCSKATNVYMKIDTQGYESNVLRGAINTLKFIDIIQMEMSLVPLYEGEVLFYDMCSLMSKYGYNLIAIENGFSDPVSGQLQQIEGIFNRTL